MDHFEVGDIVEIARACGLAFHREKRLERHNRHESARDEFHAGCPAIFEVEVEWLGDKNVDARAGVLIGHQLEDAHLLFFGPDAARVCGGKGYGLYVSQRAVSEPCECPNCCSCVLIVKGYDKVEVGCASSVSVGDNGQSANNEVTDTGGVQ